MTAAMIPPHPVGAHDDLLVQAHDFVRQWHDEACTTGSPSGGALRVRTACRTWTGASLTAKRASPNRNQQLDRTGPAPRTAGPRVILVPRCHPGTGAQAERYS